MSLYPKSAPHTQPLGPDGGRTDPQPPQSLHSHHRHIRSHLFAGGVFKKNLRRLPAQSLLCITSPSLNLVASIFCFLIARRRTGVGGWASGRVETAPHLTPPPKFLTPSKKREAIERRVRTVDAQNANESATEETKIKVCPRESFPRKQRIFRVFRRPEVGIIPKVHFRP